MCMGTGGDRTGGEYIVWESVYVVVNVANRMVMVMLVKAVEEN